MACHPIRMSEPAESAGAASEAPLEPAAEACPGPGRVDAALEAVAAWAIAGLLAFWAFRLLNPVAAAFVNVAIWAGVAVVAVLRAVPAGERAAALERSGIAWKRPLRSLALAGAYSAVVLPAYAAGYLALHGYEAWRFPGASVFGVAFLFYLFFSALTEEVFFRGLVQTRFTEWWIGGTRRFGRVVPISPAIVATAGLFALTHFILSPSQPERLATFFPGLLFGALREETGDVVAPSLFHAACNATLYGVQQGYAPA